MIADTTFLVDLARGDPGARAFLEATERGSEALRVPAPALAKLWDALERSRHPPRDQDRVRDVLLANPTVPLTAEHALRAGKILGTLARDGVEMDPFDALVAAIAIGEDEPLVTRSVGEFERVRDLRVRTY